jgi:hypothetical protein
VWLKFALCVSGRRRQERQARPGTIVAILGSRVLSAKILTAKSFGARVQDILHSSVLNLRLGVHRRTRQTRENRQSRNGSDAGGR